MCAPDEHYSCESGENCVFRLTSTTKWEHLKKDLNKMLDIFDMHPERRSDLIRMYSCRISQSTVTIQASCDGVSEDTNHSESGAGDGIHICGQKKWLDYFNMFGSVTTRLKIDYSELTDAQCRELHKLIGQTCAENLIEIKFIGIQQNNPIEDLANYQFPNVKCVEIVDSQLCDRLPLISKPFPNVRILKVVDVSMDSFDAYFRDLDRFVIVKDGIGGVQNEIDVVCRE